MNFNIASFFFLAPKKRAIISTLPKSWKEKELELKAFHL